MDSDSDPCPGKKRRAPAYSSSENDGAISNHSRKHRVILSSDSDSDSSIETVPRQKKNRPVIRDSDSSDSGSDIVVTRKRSRNRIQPQHMILTESDDSSSSDSEVVCGKRSATQIAANNDSDSSDWSIKSRVGEKVPVIEDGSSSESDGNSDKCPICLLTFKNQEVGSPESCDHSFCVECIQEWSKNVNTCPVDRQPFNLILVRGNYTGKIVRQIPIETPNNDNVEELVADDPTYCEICGRCDREDRMLLCDGCDLGFHLECLTPPLSDVPSGVWFCSDCGPEDVNQDRNIYYHEVALLIDDIEDMERPLGPRPRNTTRLVPRTRQSERVRATIISNRTQTRNQRSNDIEQIEVVVQQVGPSTSRSNRVRSRQKRVTKKTKRRKKPKIKITYEVDKETGQEIVIETKTRSYRHRKKRKARHMARRAAPPKTVKKRLAVQLGMCARSSGPTLSDIRVSTSNANIGFQRSQAGIPTLHLFGNDLDMFSGSDADNEGEGTSILHRRRPNLSDISLMRRAANRKNILLPTPASSCDVLGSILDVQEKFHSKNTVMSVKKDGTIKIDTSKSNNNNTNRVDLNDQNYRARQNTMYPNNNTSSPTSSPTNSTQTNEYRNSVNTVSNSTTISNNSVTTSSGSSGDSESAQNYSQLPHCSSFEPPDSAENKKADEQSESELDIYSDIETVSTSKAEESDKPISPVVEAQLNLQSDDEANNSDIDLVIDTEKLEDKPIDEKVEETVTSTTNVITDKEDQEEQVSTSDILGKNVREEGEEDDADSEDGCPNFSIYSTESINLAKITNVGLLNQTNEVGSSLDVVEPIPQPEIEGEEHPAQEDALPDDEIEPSLPIETSSEIEATSEVLPIEHNSPPKKPAKKRKSSDLGLYSDSDEEIVKIDSRRSFGIGDIRSLTEDISEEERSYTPCLDERAPLREGLEGLETEAISDEEKNDFDESHELKTASDAGDALEINAKDCELELNKPEDYEEGEIIDKMRKIEESKKAASTTEETNNEATNEINKQKKNKETKNPSPKDKESTFKKISKNNKDRNYRDKEKENRRSISKDRNKENEKEKRKKKERRKEIERYNVRTVVAEKPRRLKDKFGRDARRRSYSRSRSRSSSRGNQSASPKPRKRRARSNTRSKSRKRSTSRKRRSLSRSRLNKRRKSDTSRPKQRKNRSLSRSRRSRSKSPRRRRDWERRRSRPGWTPSLSRSRSRQLTPSWTPPRLLEKRVKPRNLTVILSNDPAKKKKDKRKGERKKKETAEKQRKRKRDRTPPPSKEVFASGDNILVSVSFNKENDEREAVVRRKTSRDEVSTKRMRKEKNKRSPKRKRKMRELAGVKPIAIIDLERSPFKEMTPSPQDVIILTDSESGDKNNTCDSSQQPDYATGPKTPPEPQVKFSLNAKPAQIRAINNPLHEPDDMDADIDPQEELEQRLNDTLHKGPNTPPEPPNSPPSSPDAYDPFDPTKSRSPTPEISEVQSSMTQENDETPEPQDKLSTPQPPETKSHTPPLLDIQPADSQSNTNSTDTRKTPERSISVIINQQVQSQASIFPLKASQNVAPTVTAPIPIPPRINIINATILPPTTVMSSIPQRIVLPIMTKSSPIKVAPTKPPIKSTPIKPMPKINKSAKQQNRKANDSNDSVMEFDSPYSPGPSDYEDLFEPPSDTSITNKPLKNSKSNNKANKQQSSFDVLFGSSPVYKTKGANKSYNRKRGPKTKMVGVKIDEDCLKILDDVPNSAVEMQVKDKFLKKLNRQERVVEEVKLVLKPHYNKKHVNKEEYKDILRRSVPKICHNKSGEINPKKIQNLIEAYVKKIRHSKKVTSSSSVNPQK